MPLRSHQPDVEREPVHPTTNLLLAKLSEPNFDAASLLNDILSPLNISTTQPAGTKGNRASQIQDASLQLQDLLTKLNTHNIRITSDLTQLTDEILRSGSRLAYEVEVLRGDANGLYEVLTETLHEDIRLFVSEQSLLSKGEETELKSKDNVGQDPEFITQLRMLGQVKARLEAVINVFGEAMKWAMPTSEISVASSLISVSAPELGMMDHSDQDEKARDNARKYRAEIIDLLESDGGGYAGLESATERVEQLKLLAGVWKGTVEEKVRTRFVDSLSKLVEERRKALDARSLPHRPRADSGQRSTSMPGRPDGRAERTVESSNPAAGLFRNLQKLRDEIYLD